MLRGAALSGRIGRSPIWQRWYEASENRFEIASVLQTEAIEEWPMGLLF
jgi:hypothetical protein